MAKNREKWLKIAESRQKWLRIAINHNGLLRREHREATDNEVNFQLNHADPLVQQTASTPASTPACFSSPSAQMTFANLGKFIVGEVEKLK